MVCKLFETQKIQYKNKENYNEDDFILTWWLSQLKLSPLSG